MLKRLSKVEDSQPSRSDIMQRLRVEVKTEQNQLNQTTTEKT